MEWLALSPWATTLQFGGGCMTTDRSEGADDVLRAVPSWNIFSSSFITHSDETLPHERDERPPPDQPPYLIPLP